MLPEVYEVTLDSGFRALLVERHTLHIQGVENADPLPLIGQASMTIAMAKVSTSARDARELGFLDRADLLTADPDRQWLDAARAARRIAESGFRPPKERPAIDSADWSGPRSFQSFSGTNTRPAFWPLPEKLKPATAMVRATPGWARK